MLLLFATTDCYFVLFTGKSVRLAQLRERFLNIIFVMQFVYQNLGKVKVLLFQCKFDCEAPWEVLQRDLKKQIKSKPILEEAKL